ncbi:family 16 glycosylhydrolase [Bacteroidota bacterium]
MKRIYLINLSLILLFTVLNLKSAFSCGHPPYVETSPVNNPLNKNGYNLIFNDEFNGTSLNYNLWINSFNGERSKWANKELQWYSDGNNFIFSSGKLSLVARKETVTEREISWLPDDHILGDGNPNLRTFNYTSGAIQTPFKFRYGYFEIKCKIPKGEGLWPAFWLWGTKEIDIFEFEGNSPNIIHTNWWDSGQHPQPFQIIKSAYADDVYYTYAFEWTPTHFKWYLNNKNIRTVKHSYADNVSMYVTANLAIASGHVFGGPPPSNANFFPAKFGIDYIRIYQKDEDVKPVISGPDEMVKDSRKYFQTSGYPNLRHDWCKIFGNNISNSIQGEKVSIRASHDGIMKVGLTTTLENGNKVSSSKNVLVVSSVPARPSYINGPSKIIGSSPFNSNVKKPSYVFPRTTYTSDVKPNASSYSWTISPNDGSVQIYPSGTSVIVAPGHSAYNRTYQLQLRACNMLGCSPVLTKYISVIGGLGGDDDLEKSTNKENDGVFVEDNEPVIVFDEINGIKSDCKIFPNPAKDRLNISFADEDNYNIELIDISGAVLKRLTTNNSNIIINIEEIPNGLYIIRINNLEEIWQYKVQILK